MAISTDSTRTCVLTPLAQAQGVLDRNPVTDVDAADAEIDHLCAKLILVTDEHERLGDQLWELMSLLPSNNVTIPRGLQMAGPAATLHFYTIAELKGAIKAPGVSNGIPWPTYIAGKIEELEGKLQKYNLLYDKLGIEKLEDDLEKAAFECDYALGALWAFRPLTLDQARKKLSALAGDILHVKDAYGAEEGLRRIKSLIDGYSLG